MNLPVQPIIMKYLQERILSSSLGNFGMNDSVDRRAIKPVDGINFNPNASVKTDFRPFCFETQHNN